MGNSSGKKQRNKTADEIIASLAGDQHSLVTYEQLLKAGLTIDRVRRRVAIGRLNVVHRGVYRLAGVKPYFEQKVLAACLASGGFASHRTAGALFGLRGFEPDVDAVVEVTVARGRAPKLDGVVFHRAKDLATTAIGVIPVTFPCQILLDLAAVEPQRAEGALAHALVKNLVRLPQLVRFLQERSRSGRPGGVRLRELVGAHVAGVRPTESWLEDQLLEFLRARGFPEAERQFPLALPGRKEPIRFDFAYPRCRGAVEADSRLWHASPAQQIADEERDRAAGAQGWTVERVTWLQLNESPGDVAARITLLLGRRRVA